MTSVSNAHTKGARALASLIVASFRQAGKQNEKEIAGYTSGIYETVGNGNTKTSVIPVERLRNKGEEYRLFGRTMKEHTEALRQILVPPVGCSE